MFENISVFNALYQLIMIAFWIGLIYLVFSFVRRSGENKKRIKELEKKVDYITNKIDKST